MSENLKKFLELIANDPELLEKAKQLKADNPEKTKEIAIAFAKDNGFALTVADFEVPEGVLSDAELDTIAGGGDTGGCVCMLVGGGGGKQSDDDTYGCACVGYGQGGDGAADDFTCWCTGFGNGVLPFDTTLY